MPNIGTETINTKESAKQAGAIRNSGDTERSLGSLDTDTGAFSPALLAWNQERQGADMIFIIYDAY